jgi:NADPH:quinone reductase-like Zn-dependent oxidoreductase
LVRGLERAAVGERRDADSRVQVLPQRRRGREPGPPDPARSLRTLRPGGQLVCLLPFADEAKAEAARLGLRARTMLVEADHAGMAAIADLVAHGSLRPVIAATFPLADAAKAHQRGDTRHVAGKLVLTMS